MKRYPFKFLDPYNRQDADIFFGRDEEIDMLYEMVFQSNIIFVYGASGTGKTSLIQCGLASRFQMHDWLPITIRRGSNINRSLRSALEEAKGAGDEEQPEWLGEILVDPATHTKPALTSGLSQTFKAIYLNSFRPVYLIFDQFEELYILGTPEEQREFYETIRQIAGVEQYVKLIFSIREEYLGYLAEFERTIPGLLRKKIRIETMNLGKVCEVIRGATQAAHSNIKIREGEIDAVAEAIFEKIKDKERTLTIQLPYLQVFLDKLYLEITNDNTRQADALFTVDAIKDMGEIGDVLREFLEEQVDRICIRLANHYPGVTPSSIWEILSPFATLEGTKEPIKRKNLDERLPNLDPGFVSAVIEALINSRILAYHEEVELYEIAHDSLAQHIAGNRSDDEIALLEIKRLIKSQAALKANAREFFSEKQLTLFEPYLERLKLSPSEVNLINESREHVRLLKINAQKQIEAEKQSLLERQHLLERNQRTHRKLFILVTALLVMTIGFLIWVSFLQRKAESNAKQVSQTLLNLRKEQAMSRAKELRAFGDSYFDLGNKTFAKLSYQAALDSIANYRQDSLYTVLTTKIKSCDP
jgi:hypothetical protein